MPRLATGAGGSLYTSENAVDWTPRAQGLTNWIYRARPVAGQALLRSPQFPEPFRQSLCRATIMRGSHHPGGLYPARD